MDLVQQVVADLKVERGKAERGVGALLMALRVALDKDTFQHVKQAIPESESLMGRALMSGPRTGELAAMAGPAGLMAALAAAGYGKDEIPRLGRIVMAHLHPAIGGANVEKFLTTAPALRG